MLLNTSARFEISRKTFIFNCHYPDTIKFAVDHLAASMSAVAAIFLVRTEHKITLNYYYR